MKKILSAILAICFVLSVTPAFAVEAGQGVRNAQVTMYSQATGTTAAVNTSAYTFDQVMTKVACDLISGPTTTTENITFILDGNQGSSATLFDTGTRYLITSKTLATSTTVTNMKTMATVDVPFRTMRATITSPTYTTNVITVNCSATQ